jgi:Beta-lactamase enzyme family
MQDRKRPKTNKKINPNEFLKISPKLVVVVIPAILLGMGLTWLIHASIQPTPQVKVNSTIDRTSPTLNSTAPVASKSSEAISPSPSVAVDNNQFAYKVIDPTNFIPSPKLQPIVDRIVKYSTAKKLPTDALSIALIDTKTGEIAQYQGDVERYPASVVKMFWLVAAYQKIDRKELTEVSLRPAIEQMIFKSDNQGASQILDAVTQTRSTPNNLPQNELAIGQQQRQKVNDFFLQAGYSKDINVSQKTFPIPQANIMEPKGFDQQLRGADIQKPIRNRITTNDAARLMYEIVSGKSIDPITSQKMTTLLTRNTDPNFWKKQPPNPVDFNPVESFFGEGLPVGKTKDIVSKAGWTSASRQEVAFIQSKDGQTSYILAVFGDNAAYGKSKKIFPEIAAQVYKEMRTLSKPIG